MENGLWYWFYPCDDGCTVFAGGLDADVSVEVGFPFPKLPQKSFQAYINPSCWSCGSLIWRDVAEKSKQPTRIRSNFILIDNFYIISYHSLCNNK